MSGIYANGRAKALSNNLLTSERVNRMIDSMSADEAVKILSEVNFGDNIVVPAVEIDSLISVEKEKLSQFIKSTCDDEKIKKYLLIKSDFHNAELFIKAKYLKFNSEDMIENGGIIDAKMMKESIMIDEYRSFPKSMAKALEISDYEFTSNKATGMSIGSLFIKAYYEELYNCSKGNKFLEKLFTLEVDSANISIAIRSRDFSVAKEQYIEHGTLSQSDIKSLCEDAFDTLKEKYRFYTDKELILSAIEDAEKNQPLSRFEKIKDSLAVKILNEYRYEIEGYVPFLQYCYYKLADMFNVRVIVLGLVNGQTKEQIKERLRSYYEG